ncbi:cohesin domain-containing protein [Paenibacillus planticolens]|uniref:Probable pectate lyase C n=1 Tax=Paenibacillus planticolens TaxID=2654976 RepID=A0ABX1ZWD9_9BACL|nr:cohesin domain-containing protein [Paenibacillus planticolens]NOV04360.1 hypothetical protein [Paenibacillus planticolens]
MKKTVSLVLSLLIGLSVFFSPADTNTASAAVMPTAAEVAASITSVAAPPADAPYLVLPSVPDGFRIRINSTSNANVIKLYGSIIPPAVNTNVNLTFIVTRTTDTPVTTATTGSITVTVPAKTGSAIWTGYEAESAAITSNTATQPVTTASCSGTTPCSGTGNGQKLKNLGNGPDRYVTFENVTVPSAGPYFMQMAYGIGSGSRSFFISVNGGEPSEVSVSGPGTDFNPILNTFTIINLNAGTNSIKVYNNTAWAPDFDRIVIGPVITPIVAYSMAAIDGPAGSTAAQVAATITSIPSPAQDAASLTLPAVPAGFTLAIKSSDNPAVIQTNGTIFPPKIDTTVTLVLEVTRTSDQTTALTSSIPVSVPAKSVKQDNTTGIRLKEPAYNYVSGITEDAITITSGDTYMYTVDTAEGAGRTTLTIKTVGELLNSITAASTASQTYTVKGAKGTKQMTDPIEQGDIVTVTAGPDSREYAIKVIKGALRGKTELVGSTITANTPSDVVLNFFAGMRSPATEVALKVPKGIGATMDNTSVNVIGRGKVKLSGLATQSVGRTGAGYRFPQVGTAAIANQEDGSQLITLRGLDLRPANGEDLQITFEGVTVTAGSYEFAVSYTTSEPEILTSPWGGATLNVVSTVSDFHRVLDKSLTYKETADTYTKAKFSWSAAKGAASMKLMQSTDQGATWTESNASVGAQSKEVEIANLAPNTEYYFKLAVAGGVNAGDSNIAKFYTGKFNAKLMGAKGDGKADDTQAIDNAILYLNALGGGTLLFENGTFNVRTVHLQSNVYLYVNQDATLSALKGGDAPETTYFSDLGYRSGTSATSTGPYKDPENYLTKQDVGHHYFRNSMFFGERLDNIKIIGNGRITGNGNLTTSDGVMNNAPDNRSDKMLTVKLCTNVEFGGLDNGLDLWYEETNSPTTDEPYYILSIDPDGKNELKQKDISNMLRVDRAGHFAMLSTGSENVNTHDFYYGKDASGSARDVFDYMQTSNVYAKNIYAKGTSDDIVKPGSDSSLGFTKPAANFYVRNIIGDTNCNLFQIGSETVDDIKNAYVDNIYVLAGNKAGFSISTNDGATVENIYLNYGQTGPIHHKAQMRRTRAPFFISISNRGRVIGGDAVRMKWMENGVQRDELLSKNVNIGHVRNIFIKDVNIEEVYGGSQYSNPSKRWVPYTNQSKATPIIAGYKVGDGGPALPDGRSIGYIENLHFDNVDVLVKGGNSIADAEISPPELGVGKYNISDIGEQPSYGFWARHVDGLTFTNVTTRFEKNDDRYAIVLDDVKNAILDNVKMVKGSANPKVIQLKDASNITVTNTSYYKNTWGNQLTALADLSHVTVTGKQSYPLAVQDPHNTSIQLKAAGHPNLTNLDTAAFTITATLGTTVVDMINQLESTDGTVQTYAITDSANKAKNSGVVEAGDLLVVTAQDGTTKKSYLIFVPLEILLKADSQLNSVVKSIPSITLSTSSTNGISYLQTNAVPVGEWIELSIAVPAAGTYQVSFQYKTNTTGRATVQPYVNGVAKGSPVNENNATANLFIPVDLGQVTFAAAGSYPVRFVATSAGSIVIDYIKLTAIRESGATKSALSGTESVKAGESFDVTYGLSNVNDTIYAQDITFTYDPEKVEFVSAASVKDGLQIVDRKETPGQVRIIAASLGAGNTVNNGGDLLKLSWKAKSLSQSTTTAIALSSVIVSNGEGVETQVEGVSHHVSIEAMVTVDKTALYNVIASAQSKHDSAVEGGSAGQYPAGSKAALQTAIESAKRLADNSASTQQQVDEAEAALSASLEAFLASVNTGVRGDVNGDSKVTVGDLAIAAKFYGKSSADPDWEQCKSADVNGDGIIDITDLAIIARAIFEN